MLVTMQQQQQQHPYHPQQQNQASNNKNNTTKPPTGGFLSPNRSQLYHPQQQQQQSSYPPYLYQQQQQQEQHHAAVSSQQQHFWKQQQEQQQQEFFFANSNSSSSNTNPILASVNPSMVDPVLIMNAVDNNNHPGGESTELLQEDPDDLSSADAYQNNRLKSSLYKTELCKQFQDVGTCRYGVKCQFAHGLGELRHVIRHPKYKTTKCKSYWGSGHCPYGNRCRFIHEQENHSPGGVIMNSNSSFPMSNSSANNGSIPQNVMMQHSLQQQRQSDVSLPTPDDSYLNNRAGSSNNSSNVSSSFPLSFDASYGLQYSPAKTSTEQDQLYYNNVQQQKKFLHDDLSGNRTHLPSYFVAPQHGDQISSNDLYSSDLGSIMTPSRQPAAAGRYINGESHDVGHGISGASSFTYQPRGDPSIYDNSLQAALENLSLDSIDTSKSHGLLEYHTNWPQESSSSPPLDLSSKESEISSVIGESSDNSSIKPFSPDASQSSQKSNSSSPTCTSDAKSNIRLSVFSKFTDLQQGNIKT